MKKTFLLFLVPFLFISVYAKTISNSDKPLKGNWDLQLKKIWEIEGTDSKSFGRIQNLKMSKNGNIHILDNKLKQILIFDKDGKFLAEFGKMGEGPGEFKRFRIGEQLFVLETDIVFVDVGRIHYFSLDGKFKKTVKIPESIKPRSFISREVLISAPVMVLDSGEKEESVKSYNVFDKTEKIISKFRPFEKASASSGNRGNRIRVGIVIGGITPMMNLGYKNGALYYGMSNQYKITRRDLKNKKETLFKLDGRERKAVSAKFLTDFSKRLKNIPEEMKKKIINGLPKKASYFQRIYILDNGLVYVFLADPGNSSTQNIDIFSSEGSYLYSTRIRLENESDIGNIQFHEDHMIISFEDEEGEIKLAKYQVKHPHS